MRRVLALLALATAAALAARSLPASRQPAASRATPELGCKPLAPIDVSLAPGPSLGPSSQPITFSIRPLCAMTSITWSWELSPGVVLSTGAVAGTAAAASGATTSGNVTVSVPADGAFHAATLLVSGTLAGNDEFGPTGPETVVASRSLSWGQAASTVPEVLSPDVESGGLVPVAVVPSSHAGPP